LSNVRDPATPIVFAGVFDVRSNFQAGYSSNVYGFISYTADLCGQWPGLLMQMAPNLTSIAVITDRRPSGIPGQQTTASNLYDQIVTAANNCGLSNVSAIDVRPGDDELEFAISDFADQSGGAGGLIVPAKSLTATRRKTITKLAAKYALPTIYPNRMYATDGGLMSMGPYTPTLYLYAGHYANQVLNKTSPTPRIAPPEKYELIINMRTANELGLTVPSTLLTQATLIIE
jgi:putative tryptophan/tyrosine transport system substrate-binding protein